VDIAKTLSNGREHLLFLFLRIIVCNVSVCFALAMWDGFGECVCGFAILCRVCRVRVFGFVYMRKFALNVP